MTDPLLKLLKLDPKKSKPVVKRPRKPPSAKYKGMAYEPGTRGAKAASDKVRKEIKSSGAKLFNQVGGQIYVAANDAQAAKLRKKGYGVYAAALRDQDLPSQRFAAKQGKDHKMWAVVAWELPEDIQGMPGDGRGRGVGMPGGRRRNKNVEPCELGGPGFGKGRGRGRGQGRKQEMKINEDITLDVADFRRASGMSEAPTNNEALPAVGSLTEFARAPRVTEVAVVTPESYAKQHPKVLKELGEIGKAVQRDIGILKGDKLNPRRAFVAAMNLGFWAERVSKILGDDAAVKAYKTAQEHSRKSAVQWPSDG